jgi:hypothetical protein
VCGWRSCRRSPTPRRHGGTYEHAYRAATVIYDMHVVAGREYGGFVTDIRPYAGSDLTVLKRSCALAYAIGQAKGPEDLFASVRRFPHCELLAPGPTWEYENVCKFVGPINMVGRVIAGKRLPRSVGGV